MVLAAPALSRKHSVAENRESTTTSLVEPKEPSSTVAPDDERTGPCSYWQRAKCYGRCGLHFVKDCYQIKPKNGYKCECNKKDANVNKKAEVPKKPKSCYLFYC